VKQQQILAERYAKALLEIGNAGSQSDQIGKDLESFQALLKENEMLQSVFQNPIFAQAQRQAVLKDIFGKQDFLKTTQNFLLLLIEKKRAGIFSAIAKIYQDLLDKQNQRLHVRVASAHPLTDEYLAKLQAQLKEMTQQEVIIHTETDPSLIGGVVTWIGDKMYDGTLQTRLRLLKEHLREHQV